MAEPDERSVPKGRGELRDQPQRSRGRTTTPHGPTSGAEAGIAALAELPLARACGLGPALANDLTALAAGDTPRLRVALGGTAPAVRRLTAPLRRGLPADAVRLGSRPADCHLLLYAVGDRRTPAHPGDPEAPGRDLTALLVRPGAPRACVVVVAEDDWGGLGLDSVAGWNRDRLWEWPEPWRACAVRAVVPPGELGRLMDEELVPAVEQRHVLVAELVRVRLARALRLIGEAARDVTAEAGTGPADAWLRLQGRAGGPAARRLLRLLNGFPDGTPRPTDGSNGRDGEVA
ncbi:MULTISPECIES: hypothetical protein [Streptomyces]|uniref:Uncharacterized protein n=2 Tax=Streptomyces TaxID=1883 RepID=A0ABV9IL84_9ACTN